MNDAVLPAINARNATCAKSLCRSGAMVANAAIWVPIDPGLANPHNAKVAIVSDRFCILLKEKKTILKMRKKNNWIFIYTSYRDNALRNIFRQFTVCGKLVDDCLNCHQIGDEITF